MTKREKKRLLRILIAGIIFGVGWPLHHGGWIGAVPELILFLAAYLIAGYDIVWKALQGISRGQVFDENFLMTLATVGAFCLGEYPEGVAVMLFYQVGELFQSYAVSKSRRSISALMDIRPEYANMLKDGQLIEVSPEDVHVGDIIVVKPGERIPLDGIVTEGCSSVDASALTGESMPRDTRPGEEILSGCINQTGRLSIQVTKEYGESTVARILELVENASEKKSRSEQFITRFARYYTPCVVIAAALLAILPPLLLGQAFAIWVTRALTFLVISCPCALVISVPLSFFGGIGGASKAGVLIKGSNYLEMLANVDTVVFDKTGTLTRGVFTVSEVQAKAMSPEAFLRLAAHAEKDSSHPIAMSIRRAYAGELDDAKVGAVSELAGYGVRAVIEGREVLAGNARLMEDSGIAFAGTTPEGTMVHIAVDGEYAGYLRIEDEIKQDASQAIEDLKAMGIRRAVMLTGDSHASGLRVATSLGLDEVYAELLPADKVEKLEWLMGRRAGGRLAFVGDGINDAPVLARADVGIAMGGLGSDAAIEAADVVIMTDEPSKIAAAMRISRKTLRIVRQNIVFALGVKGIVLILGAAGLATMWAAVFADVGVSVLAILNAIRALNISREIQPKRPTGDPERESGRVIA